MNRPPPRPGSTSTPPRENTAVAAWYRACSALTALAVLEEKIFVALGQQAADIRTLKLASRRSGHALEEIKGEQKEREEISEVHELRQQHNAAMMKLQAELTAARQAVELSEKEKARSLAALAQAKKDRRVLWGGRVWSVVLLVLAALVGFAAHALRSK